MKFLYKVCIGPDPPCNRPILLLADKYVLCCSNRTNGALAI